MTELIKIKRTLTPNHPPANLSLQPGELAVEMAAPTRLWVGVPPAIDATGKKLLIDVNAITASKAAVSDVPPPAPVQGALWYENDTGILWIFYDDGNTQQWVQVNGISVTDSGLPYVFGPGAATVDNHLIGWDGVDGQHIKDLEAAIDGIAYARRNAAWVSVLRTIGGTITGNLIIDAASPALALRKTPGTSASIIGATTANLARWNMMLGDSGLETGANAGSDFTLFPYNDAGAVLSGVPAIRFVRATNKGEVAGDPIVPLGIATKQYVDNALLAVSGFPAGTLMLFQQTAAPTGWTKQTTHNDKTLRVVSGAAGSGGSSSFSVVFGLTSTNNFTLGNSHVPNTPVMFYTGDFVGTPLPGAGPAGVSPWAKSSAYATLAAYISSTGSEGVQGGGGPHAHGIDLRVAYVDLIIASKN